MFAKITDNVSSWHTLTIKNLINCSHERYNCEIFFYLDHRWCWFHHYILMFELWLVFNSSQQCLKNEKFYRMIHSSKNSIARI